MFVESFAPPPRMVIFGAVDFTAALARVAKVLGYHVTVCDAREVFATRKRFPMADEVVVDWPDRHLAAIGDSLGPRDAVCVLTHDAKFDVPAIMSALNTNVGYLGAMGSRRTHADRVERLRSEGVDEAALARLMAPIGLDIGARTPEEAADLDLRGDHRVAHRSGRARRAAARRVRTDSLTVAAVVLAAGEGSRFDGADAQAARAVPRQAARAVGDRRRARCVVGRDVRRRRRGRRRRPRRSSRRAQPPLVRRPGDVAARRHRRGAELPDTTRS